jgi:hypothetical protein
MSRFREKKRQMRRHVHAHLNVPALLLTDQSDLIGLPITVRLHTKFGALGDLAGARNMNPAEFETLQPKAIFWREELIVDPPRRGQIISVEPGEAYYCNHAEEPDDLTVTVTITKIEPIQTVNFPVPDA